ncbi:hypothetical protein BGZ93_008681 [Podila epicladia]|nr:hypothetical protein BGZ92_009207 [Podila epicladia]KAG0091774.1 hypothetical protein BGZ93_008681 [Podila epicladia]
MSGPKPAADSITARHVLYLIVMHTIGAMILDFGFNFGLATAMYKSANEGIYLWPLPKTLAGDAAVTIIIQQLLTWFLDRLAVRGDLSKGLVAPLRMPKDAGRIIRWFVGLDHVGVHKSFGDKVGHFFGFHIKRIAVLCVATFVLFWPITVGVLTVLKNHGIGADHGHHNGDFNRWPFPELYKGIYGAAVGMTTPFISYIALVYNGETQSKSVVTEDVVSNEDV